MAACVPAAAAGTPAALGLVAAAALAAGGLAATVELVFAAAVGLGGEAAGEGLAFSAPGPMGGAVVHSGDDGRDEGTDSREGGACLTGSGAAAVALAAQPINAKLQAEQ